MSHYSRLCIALLLIAAGARAERLVLEHCRVVTMGMPAFYEDANIVIESGRVRSILPTKQFIAVADDEVLDLRGAYVMPGLCDMHVHIRDRRDLKLLVSHGVTTVRHMDGSADVIEMRREIEAGTLVGPTIYSSGPVLTGLSTAAWGLSFCEVTTPESVREYVSTLRRNGYDGVKIYEDLPRALYEVAVTTAQAENIPVWGHVPESISLEDACGGNQRTIEHMAPWAAACTASPAIRRPWVPLGLASIRQLAKGVDWDAVRRIAKVAKANETYLVPTTYALTTLNRDGADVTAEELAYVSKLRREWWKRKTSPRDPERARGIQELRRIVGVLATENELVLVGTDMGAPLIAPGESYHKELETLEECGLSSEAILAGATAKAADCMGRSLEFGRIVPGARADLVITRTDPRRGAAFAKNLDGVVLRGRYFSKSALDEMRADVLRSYEHEEIIPNEWTPEESEKVLFQRGLKLFVNGVLRGGARLGAFERGRNVTLRSRVTIEEPMDETRESFVTLNEQRDIHSAGVCSHSRLGSHVMRFERVEGVWVAESRTRQGGTSKTKLELHAGAVAVPDLLMGMMLACGPAAGVRREIGEWRGVYVVDTNVALEVVPLHVDWKRSDGGEPGAGGPTKGAGHVVRGTTDDRTCIEMHLDSGGWPTYVREWGLGDFVLELRSQ